MRPIVFLLASLLAMSIVTGCTVSPKVGTPASAASTTKGLYPVELSQVKSVTVHDYDNGAVKNVEDVKLVKQLTDKLNEARPAGASTPDDGQGFKYMMWLTLGDNRRIHLMVWPDRNTVNLFDPSSGASWRVPGLSQAIIPLLPSSDRDKKYLDRRRAEEIAIGGKSGAKVQDALLVESFRIRGHEPLTVWQIELTGTGGNRSTVIIEAATGQVLNSLK